WRGRDRGAVSARRRGGRNRLLQDTQGWRRLLCERVATGSPVLAALQEDVDRVSFPPLAPGRRWATINGLAPTGLHRRILSGAARGSLTSKHELNILLQSVVRLGSRVLGCIFSWSFVV
ncbi:unnamed protein product, partial [Ectocarpus sp. 12 AP-2014]